MAFSDHESFYRVWELGKPVKRIQVCLSLTMAFFRRCCFSANSVDLVLRRAIQQHSYTHSVIHIFLHTLTHTFLQVHS